MAAITWRQLTGADDSGAFKALDAATKTFNSGFDAINKAIESRQLANQTREEIGRKANVAAYLDTVQQANTPEAAAALQNSQELKALGASVDPRDRDLVRNAIETRLASTRQNVTAGQTYQDTQTAWNSRDAVNSVFSKAVATKDPAQLQALADSLPANHPARDDLLIKVASLVQGNAKSATDLEVANSNAAANTANAAANTSNAATNSQQATTHAQQVNQDALQKIETQRASLSEKLAGARKDQFGSDEGQKAFGASIKLVAGDNAPTILRLAGEAVSSDPKFRGLPTDVVTQIVSKHVKDFGTGEWNPTDGGTVSAIKSDLDAAFKDPNVLAQMTRSELAKQQIASQLEALNGTSDIAMRRAFPEWGAGLDAALAKRQAEAGANPGAATPPGTPTAAPVAAPAASTPNTPAAAQQQNVVMDRRVELERVKIALGEQKDFSPEVRNYMVEQNWQATENGARSAGAGAMKMGAAALDIFTLPVRGVMGAVNDVIGVPNALGANIPTIPDQGWLSSMTPYSDRLNGQSSREDLIKQRNELERSIKDASKKAK